MSGAMLYLLTDRQDDDALVHEGRGEGRGGFDVGCVLGKYVELWRK